MIYMTTIKDFIKKSCLPASKSNNRDSLNEEKTDKPIPKPQYDERGIRIETQEEIENWKKI